MKSILAWFEEFISHLRHHADPVNVPPPAAPLSVPPPGAVELVQAGHVALPTGASNNLTPPPGSPAANASPMILSMLTAGHENDPAPGAAADPAAPAAAPEDRNTGVVDRAGSPRYWKAAAGQPTKLLVKVGDFVGAMSLNVSGDAPQDGTPVESFKVRVEDAAGNVLVQEAQWTRQASITVSVGAGTGDFYVFVTPATDGAGYVERIN